MFEKLNRILKVTFFTFLFCMSLLLICSRSAMVLAQSLTLDEQAAVIFVYHRVGEDQYPASNLRLSQFKEHIHDLVSSDYNVISLTDVIQAFKDKTPLPDKTIAITFEGAFKSTLDTAIPILLKEKLPFTLFVAPSRIDWKTDNYMQWSDLKKLKKNKYVTLGLAPSEYTHIVFQEDQKIRQSINLSLARFREELDLSPSFLTYPYGEYSQNFVNIVKEYPFTAAFGQHSGVSHSDMDLYALPRFSMTESFAGIDRFQLTANAQPLPLIDVIPQNVFINKNNPPKIGFSVKKEITNIDQLSCFVSGEGKVDLKKIGQRVEIRLDGPFIDQRTRVNCTVPATTNLPGEDKRWRWAGFLFTTAEVSELTSFSD